MHDKAEEEEKSIFSIQCLILEYIHEIIINFWQFNMQYSKKKKKIQKAYKFFYEKLENISLDSFELLHQLG